ncbi:hypothetical protein [Sinimarinibacterium sp. CAU 1509]|uniref:hypothetical protein n=1 Tax=Sinimarinibacterium sp. CAU 1509 TaxID=2562283 RepID=UPI00146F0374|nr:hypothetical protein [Sinimarinibacterium sp. CAU 1509]
MPHAGKDRVFAVTLSCAGGINLLAAAIVIAAAAVFGPGWPQVVTGALFGGGHG